jgi:hypothetical protein
MSEIAWRRNNRIREIKPGLFIGYGKVECRKSNLKDYTSNGYTRNFGDKQKRRNGRTKNKERSQSKL